MATTHTHTQKLSQISMKVSRVKSRFNVHDAGVATRAFNWPRERERENDGDVQRFVKRDGPRGQQKLLGQIVRRLTLFRWFISSPRAFVPELPMRKTKKKTKTSRKRERTTTKKTTTTSRRSVQTAALARAREVGRQINRRCRSFSRPWCGTFASLCRVSKKKNSQNPN